MSPTLRTGIALAIAIVLTGAGAGRAQAATRTWVGAGTGDLWSNGLNWSPQGPLQPGDDLDFTNVASAASYDDVPDITLGSITFSASHTVNGTGIVRLAAGIINTNGVGNLVLYNTVGLTVDQTWTAVSPATIAVAKLLGPGVLDIQDETTVILNSGENTLPAIGFGGTASGTLRITTDLALTTVKLTVPAGATVDLDGHSTSVTGLDGGGLVTLGNDPGLSFTIATATPSVFTGTISGFGTLVKSGVGELTLGGPNAYGGQTLIMAGTLRVTHDAAFGAMSGTLETGTIVSPGTMLILDQVTIGNEQFFIYGGTDGPGTLRVDGPGASSVAGQVTLQQDTRVTGTGGVLLTLSGPVATSATLDVTGVALHVTLGASAIAGVISVGANGTLALDANNLLAGTPAITLNGGTLALDGHTAAAREVTGSGTVALGTNGTLELAIGGPSTFSVATTGTGVIKKTGLGTLTFPAPTALNGSLLVQIGGVSIAHSGALLSTNIIVSNSATLVYATPMTTAAAISLEGNGPPIPPARGALQVIGGNVTFTGPTTIPNHATVYVAAASTLMWQGLVTADTLTVRGDGTALFGTPGHVLTGSLSVGSTSEEGTTVRLGAAGALASQNLIVKKGAHVDLNGFDLSLRGLVGQGHIDIDTGTLTFSNPGSYFFEGVFSGTGAVIAPLTSPSAITLTGTHTLSGTFTASSVLQNFGVLPASVTLTSGNLTLGQGSVTGPVKVLEGFVSIGSQTEAGTTTVGGLDISGTTSLFTTLHAGDPLTVHGTVTLAGMLSLLPGTFVPTPGRTLTLIDNDGSDPIVGTFTSVPEGGMVMVGSTALRISYVGGSGNDVTLTEPLPAYYLSEGATGPFFDTDLLIANPNASPVTADVTFAREGGTPVITQYTLAPLSRLTIPVDQLPGMEHASFSTTVAPTTNAPLVVERTMRWDASGYGAHTEKATSGPSQIWFFAEGSEGFFRTYLLLANPAPVANTVAVFYQREGEAMLTRVYAVPPESRLTIQAADDPDLVGRSFGMTVVFDRPGIAERAMYFGTNPAWKGGHESAGETTISPTWFLAEGATGGGFDTFILVANPLPVPADVTFTFLSESAEPVSVTKTLDGQSRLTLNIEAEGLAIPDGPVATQITATGPIVAERSQYWPYTFDRWTESHNSFGVIAAGTKWGLAEGRAGGPEDYQTYILLANAGTSPATVSLEFLGDGQSLAPANRTIVVPPQRRVTVFVEPTGAAGSPAATFGATITADNPIVVERALYWNVNGEVWAAGTNATATRLP